MTTREVQASKITARGKYGSPLHSLRVLMPGARKSDNLHLFNQKELCRRKSIPLCFPPNFLADTLFHNFIRNTFFHMISWSLQYHRERIIAGGEKKENERGTLCSSFWPYPLFSPYGYRVVESAPFDRACLSILLIRFASNVRSGNEGAVLFFTPLYSICAESAQNTVSPEVPLN